MSERLVIIPVNRALRDKIKEMKQDLSYSKYLTKLISEGQDLRLPPSDESLSGDSNIG